MMLSYRHMLFGKFSNCQIIFLCRVLPIILPQIIIRRRIPQLFRKRSYRNNRDDNSSVRVELNEDEPFSGDSGKLNSEVGSTLSQEVKCPLSVAPAQTRKYGDAQLLVFFESLFDRKLYRSFIVFMLLIVSLILVMCHSILSRPRPVDFG